MHRVSKWLRIFTVSALTIVGFVTGATGPAAAGDPPSSVSPATLQAVCKTLGGAYAEDRTSYSCDFTDSVILCREDRCGYASRLENPPLRDECEYAEGIFHDLGIRVYLCELLEIVITVDCTKPWDWWSDQPMSLCAVEFSPHDKRIRVR
ncbi:hypothetical protein [Catellatospora citrea]|uniref:Subtilisin inhibitor-like n=1 Tax=Catellatospora citrea TaxID=53366 RepID=A0A8J3KCU9_9ACTN|nr:hypothetical protein [Catellatospora citrea]RKE11246.1 hypothetical protein C8E86_6170 [Catellatospora citrea]GIF96713.1 hypothetical protein Cci01nite_18070 [Catellatospora citrea]